MPLVHNGIMYLVNTGNIVQALDGRTGELIWEHRVGPRAAAGAMRNMAIYQDKMFVATTDARLVGARRAHRQARVGDAHRRSAQRATAPRAGPIVINGKVVQGLNGCDRFKEDGCFISAYDAAHRQAAVAVQHRRAARRTRRRHVGQAADDVPRRRRDLDHRQLRSRSESHLLGRGAGQAVGAGEPRHDGRSTRRCTRARRSRSIPTPASWRGTSSMRPAKRSTSTKCSSACSSTSTGGKLVFTIGKPGILWKLDRRTGEFLGYKETVFQNIFDSHRSEDRRARRTAADIIEAKVGEWVPACPSTEGGHNWQAMSYHPGTQPAHHPAQPDAAWRLRAARWSSRKGRAARPADRRFFEMPGTRRQHRQARGLRRAHDAARCGATSSARRS